MSSSFVGLKNLGFWMRDGDLSLWLRLLALHVENPAQSVGSAATAIRDQWLLASGESFTGCIPHGLEKAVATAEGAAVVRKAVASLLAALEVAPDRLSAGALNLLGTPGVYLRDYETRWLIEVGHAFSNLLDGRADGLVAASSVPRQPFPLADA